MQILRESGNISNSPVMSLIMLWSWFSTYPFFCLKLDMGVIPTAIPLSRFTTWAKAHTSIFVSIIEAMFVNIITYCVLSYIICILGTDDAGLLGSALRHCKWWDVMCCCYLKCAWCVKKSCCHLDLNQVITLYCYSAS